MKEPKVYVSTLVFDPHHATVLLVKKKRPSWLAGRWTAVGGEQEPDESPAAAAIRELGEESGFEIESVVPFAYVRREASICTMFAAEFLWPHPPTQCTDEEVKIWDLDQVQNDNPKQFSNDLRWLIEMALDALREKREGLPVDMMNVHVRYGQKKI